MGSTVLAPPAPPTMDDARSAAGALAEAGVSWVMVFGSVARGEATEDSDIDLVAVYDDLDYSNRQRIREKLCAVAEAATGHECGVVVTDRPEWRTRVANVSSSFEHAISKDAVTLADTGPGPEVDWHKTQVKPMNNRQQGLEYLDDSAMPQIRELGMFMFRTSLEEALAPNTAYGEEARLDRMRKICDSSSMAVELLVKALVQFAGEHPISDKQMKAAGHDIEKGVNQLPARLRAPTRRAVSQFGLSLSDLSSWRVAGTYPGDIDTERAVADEWADDYARTALSVAFSVLDEAERHLKRPHKTVNKIRGQVARMSDIFQKHDIRYDKPLDEPDPAKAPVIQDLAQTELLGGPDISALRGSPPGSAPTASDERAMARRMKRKGLGNKAIARRLRISEKRAQQHTQGMPPGRN